VRFAKGQSKGRPHRETAAGVSAMTEGWCTAQVLYVGRAQERQRVSGQQATQHAVTGAILSVAGGGLGGGQPVLIYWR